MQQIYAADHAHNKEGGNKSWGFLKGFGLQVWQILGSGQPFPEHEGWQHRIPLGQHSVLGMFHPCHSQLFQTLVLT